MGLVPRPSFWATDYHHGGHDLNALAAVIRRLGIVGDAAGDGVGISGGAASTRRRRN